MIYEKKNTTILHMFSIVYLWKWLYQMPFVYWFPGTYPLIPKV